MVYMMHSSRLLPLLAAVAMVTTILSSSLNTATAEEDQPIYMNYSCSPKFNFTDDSPYGKNLAELLSTLSTPPSPSTVLDNWWFRRRTVNQSSAAVSGLAMCYADSDEHRCRSCLTAAAVVLSDLCSHSRNASFISSGGCVVRYADGGGATFFGSAAADFDTTLFLRNMIIEGDAMRETRQALLSRLAETACRDDGDGGLRFAAGSQAYVDGDVYPIRRVMYGMAQCTRDLPMSACSGCLVEHLATMYKETEMTNSTGAVVMGLSCYLTYQVDRPIDIAGLPQAPSPAPAPTITEGPKGSSAPPLLVGKTTMVFSALLAAAPAGAVMLLNVVAGV